MLSCFRAFRGECNPHYEVCIPEKLERLWIPIELLSAIPYIVLRLVIGRLSKFTVFDRGVADFIVWIITILSYPRFYRVYTAGFYLDWL